MSMSNPPGYATPSPACARCTRRQFVSASVIGTVTALLAACGDGVIGGVGNITGPATSVSLTVKLSDYPALANVGGVAILSGTTTPIAVVRTAASTYVALSLVCPHQGTTVNLSGGRFICSNHGATFNTSGTWTGGQPTSSLVALTSTLNAAAGSLAISGTVRRGGGDDDDDDDDDH
jgi:Rieske Fe-S protein